MPWLLSLSEKHSAFVLSPAEKQGKTTSHFPAVLAIEQQCGANTSFETQELFMLRGRKAEQTDRSLPPSGASTPHGSGEGVPPQCGCGANCIFPHRHEFAWKLPHCVGRTLLNISPRELYSTWEFALWAVSLLDQESEIPR